MKWKHILAIGLSAAMVMCTVLKEGTIVYANTEMDAISHGGKTFEAAGIQVEDGENPEGAFSDCTSLKKFDFSDVSRIEKLAFYNCSSLENLKIPDTANTIPEGAFADRFNLKTIILPKSVSSFAKNFIIDFSPVKRNSSNYCEVRKKNYKVQNYSKIN